MNKRSFIIFAIIAHLMVPNVAHANSTTSKTQKSLKERISEWVNEHIDWDTVIIATSITFVAALLLFPKLKKTIRPSLSNDPHSIGSNKNTRGRARHRTNEHQSSTESIFEEGECPMCCGKPNDGLQPLHDEDHKCSYAVCNTCLNNEKLYKADGRYGPLTNCPACNTYAENNPHKGIPGHRIPGRDY